MNKFSVLSSAECGESRPISWQLLWLVASLETGRSRFGAVRLSQCSKRLRDITQPVLFHVFHSPVRHSSKATHRSLAAFVSHPVLAPRPSFVGQEPGAVCVRRRGPAAFMFELVRPGTKTRTRQCHVCAGCRWSGVLVGGSPFTTLLKLKELAIATAPQARYVFLQQSFLGYSPAMSWTSWPQRLENLRHREPRRG